MKISFFFVDGGFITHEIIKKMKKKKEFSIYTNLKSIHLDDVQYIYKYCIWLPEFSNCCEFAITYSL